MNSEDKTRPLAPPISGDDSTRNAADTAATTPTSNWIPPGDGTECMNAAAVDEALNQSGPADIPPLIPNGFAPLRKLGEGTYGKVWLFRVEHTGIQVAVKFFARGAGLHWQLLQAEVRQLAMLHDDPGIVQLKDLNAETDPPYYVMTYAPGGSLADRLRDGPLPLRDALRIFREVAAALAYVHARGIRHCDLKPGNVLLDARGRALIADFGQAHLHSDDTPALGTFFYMAPEQADLSHTIPDTGWDVYGLGALLYVMLTGRPPREDSSLRDELASTVELSHRLRRYREGVRTAPPPREHYRVAGMDRSLAEIVDRCLELDPQRRPRDAGAVLDLLDRRDRRKRQRPLLAAGLLAPLLLLAVTAIMATWAVRTTRLDSEQMVIERLKDNDPHMARLIANSLESEIERRFRAINRCAASADYHLGESIRDARGEKDQLAEVLSNLGDDWKRMFYKLMLVDRSGYMIADLPHNPKLLGKRWCWREWFNGEKHRFGQEGAWFEPLNHPMVSGPYRSKDDGSFVVTFSSPVVDPDVPEAVLGVLIGSVKIETLSQWTRDVNLRKSGGAVVVLNRHRHILLHSLARESIIGAGIDKEAPAYDAELFRDLIDARKEETSTDHEDPLLGHSWVASGCPLPTAVLETPQGKVTCTSGWGVVVQHEKNQAFEPLNELRDHLRWIGIASLAALALLTTGLWSWLIWTLRREEVRG